MSTETNEVKKRRGTSIPLLIGFLILGVIGYYAGPSIMTYAFYLQESLIAGSGTNGGDIPAGITPDTSGDPNVGAGPSAAGPGPGGPGGGGAGASSPDNVADPSAKEPTKPADATPPSEPSAK